MCVGVDIHPEHRVQIVELDIYGPLQTWQCFKFQWLITSRYGKVGDLMMSPVSCS